MTQAINILEKHRMFLFEVEREADVQDAIKAITITVKQQAEELERLREKTSALTQELDECGMLEKTLRELVKRQEAALEWICSGEYDCWKHIDDGTYRVNCVCHPGVSCKAMADTPLAAIEAAMKEASDGTI